jgi:hypothetical protein
MFEVKKTLEKEFDDFEHGTIHMIFECKCCRKELGRIRLPERSTAWITAGHREQQRRAAGIPDYCSKECEKQGQPVTASEELLKILKAKI